MGANVNNTALSGLNTSSENLDIISNNIANANTVGFKASTAQFADIYSGTFSGSATSAGNGVILSASRQSFSNGTLTTTSNALDLAINGGGFFRMSSGAGITYSRNGQFSLNNQNELVNSAGQNLTGLLADTNGAITGALGNITISSANSPPRASTSVTVGTNIDSTASASTTNWVGGATPATTSFNNVTSSTVYDSLGNAHVLSVYFIKADASAAAINPNSANPPGTQNQWYAAFQIDNQELPLSPPYIAAAPGVGNVNNLATINFNSDGTYQSVGTALGTPPAGGVPLSINLNNGATPLVFTVDFSSSTQFGAPFAVQTSKTDGFTTGSVSGVSISSDGIISSTYSNGQTRSIGQIQLATFPNLNGLQSVGQTSWVQTAASGQPLLGTPNSGNLGSIDSGTTENSNVDLTRELVNLITAQRSFQANAQSIKTSTAITDTIIQIG